MSGLIDDGFTRAATFFALAFACMSIGGFLIGEPRIGVQWGFGLGIAFGVFAYLFVKPAGGPDVLENDQ